MNPSPSSFKPKRAFALMVSGKRLGQTWFGMSSWGYSIFSSRREAEHELKTNDMIPNTWKVIEIEIRPVPKKSKTKK